MKTRQPFFELIICTCDAFSDLWEAHMALLSRNWGDRGVKTYLVTDKPTDRRFEGVTVVAAGEGAEITDRLQAVLRLVETPYILFTLDDYFLTQPINTAALLHTVDFMQAEQVDYVRLYAASRHYLRREGATECAAFPDLYFRNIDEGDYKISLYPGLWRTSFMQKTLATRRNAWEYEVSLTPMARALHARCAISNRGEFPFLDVIRKGKVLRAAQRYFRKDPVYHGDRPVMRARDEASIWFRTKLRHILPRSIFQKGKRFLKKRGRTFYSPTDE